MKIYSLMTILCYLIYQLYRLLLRRQRVNWSSLKYFTDCFRICVDILKNEEVDFFKKSFTLGQCNKSSIVKRSIRTKLYTLADIVPTCDSSTEFPRMGFNLFFTFGLVLVFISYLLIHSFTLPLVCHLHSVTLSLLCRA